MVGTSAVRTLRATLDFGNRRTEAACRRLLEIAGVEVGGSAPHDIEVHDSRTYGRWLREGTLGMGESYMDGWWDCDAIDQLISRMLLANLRDHIKRDLATLGTIAMARLVNLQDVRRAKNTVARIYDVGTDVYEAMLDRRMLYTCGYWKQAVDLDSAQEAKAELICRKLGLEPGMRVLELGCGWGGFAHYAATQHGVHVTGLTISTEQLAIARERCDGLDVDFRFEDYRRATGHYDAIVSMGLIEHVGHKNYRAYMEVVDRCLSPGGVALVHTIAGNRKRRLSDPWVRRYIFPEALLPTIAQLGQAMEGLLVLEDVHNFGPDYDRTLLAWNERFEAAWPELESRYDERFRRMWRYYLLSCAASSRARDLQLLQLVMTRTGTPRPDCRYS